MNILMMTNVYKPLVGGLEKSVEIFSRRLEQRGHSVLVAAPQLQDAPEREEGIIRIPAVQNFNGTDFAVPLPLTSALKKELKNFRPDIVHAHHPFLIGDTAQRVSAEFSIPVVFTYHTSFEQYTHYVPGNSPALKRFVRELTTGYANLCDRVIAPCEDIRTRLEKQGVTTPISVLPTGIETNAFSPSGPAGLKKKLGIDSTALLLGFISRIAPEKNSRFLARAVSQYLAENRTAHFLIAGKGPSLKEMLSICDEAGVRDRCHAVGVLKGDDLTEAYRSLDLFVYASKTETQGLVIAESFAAGTPVIALKAPAIRNIMKDN
ncbi:MAG: glycosyltransferase, partial [Fibrobacterota bacterium]